MPLSCSGDVFRSSDLPYRRSGNVQRETIMVGRDVVLGGEMGESNAVMSSVLLLTNPAWVVLSC